MERMIIFCMLLFCARVALGAAQHKTAKYKQVLKTIKRLAPTVKDKDVELLHTPENPVDGCLFTAVSCFQKGVLKLQPQTSQVNPTFSHAVRILKSPFGNPGENCETPCESYEKKKPKEFLKSFEKLIQK
ncbi:PREDICTED: interleukin-21, partial [Merops nubicus]|uniref:interleukin-21 n=1 Tax=Merops nubicus TaxID=57421 RepID=UPI0004F032C5